MFGFDFFFFLLECITLSVWQTKGIKIGENHSSKVNFANIDSQAKYVDTLK